MANFVKVASVDQVPEDHGLTVEVGGQKIALFRVGTEYYAIGGECTHVGGPLAEGGQLGEDVVCPWHGARFNIKTGKHLTPPARGDVPSFPVRLVGADIEIEMP